MSANEIQTEGRCLPCQGAETQAWYAWIDLMPPRPDFLHVVGEVLVSNPGVVPSLHYHSPQGINPRILLLDLHLIQRPGFWPPILVWKPVRYDRVVNGAAYDEVDVLCGGEIIARIPVEVVS